MCTICNFLGLDSSLLSSNLTTAPAAPSPGSDGLGDSLYPGFGNGGYDVQHYTLDLNVKDVTTSVLTGVATIEAEATQSLSSFNLDFIGFAIDGITVNGETAAYSREGQELTITLPEALDVGESFTVEVKYAGSPEQITSVAIPVLTGWVNFGEGSFVLSEPDGAANYYPVNDHPLDKASYTFRVTVPDPYEVAANGVLEETIDNGDTTTYVWEARDRMASYLTTVNISEFDVETEEAPNGIPIRNYFAEGIPEELLKPFDLQPEMMAYFSDIFGPYPFEVYGAVVMNTETGSALETQTMSIFGIDSIDGDSAEDTIAHELAHQWFGDSVALADWSDIWLNESFATYAEGLWIEYSQGKNALNDWVKDTYNTVVKYLDELVPPGLPLADDLFNSGVYIWGAVGLHDLRLEIGDDDFFKTLQTYYDRFRDGNVTTKDFIAVAKDVSGQDLETFFDRWIYSSDIPAIPELGLSANNQVTETAINLLDFAGYDVEATVSISEETVAYNNQGGFYAVDNPNGIIVDPLTGSRIAPGDAGYAKAALQKSVKQLDNGEATFTLEGGSYYVPYLIANGNPENFYTPFTAANSDNLDHVDYSMGTYRFEDLLNLGDKDFNDFIVKVEVTPIIA